MTIEEATRILKERTSDWHTQSAAAAYTISFYNEHSDRLRPLEPKRAFVTDAARPQHQRDIAPMTPNWEAARSNPEAGGGRVDMGRDPGSPSGAKLVQVLPGDVSAYFIAADGSGRACLYRTVEADDAIDPYRTATGTRVAATADRAKFMRDAQTRAGLEQFRNASIALRTQAFWEDQREAPTHDAAPQPQGRIGAQVAAFWDKQRGAA